MGSLLNKSCIRKNGLELENKIVLNYPAFKVEGSGVTLVDLDAILYDLTGISEEDQIL